MARAKTAGRGARGAAPQNSRQAARQALPTAAKVGGGAAEQEKKPTQGLRSVQPFSVKNSRKRSGNWESYDYESEFDLPLDELTEAQIREMIDQERRVVYATKIVKHGTQADVEVYPDFTHLPGTIQRDRSNREAQRNLNDRNSRKECERRINANFGPADYWVTLSCQPREEPQTMEEAQRLFQNYIKRINYRRKKKNLPPARYVYVTDWTKDGRRVRTHYHLVMDGDLPMEEVLELWGHGRKNKIEYLVLDERGLSGLAYYITKPHASDTEDVKHKKKWTASKNLKRPAERKNHRDFGRRKVERLACRPADIYATMESKYPRYWCEAAEARHNGVNGYFYIRAVMRERCQAGDLVALTGRPELLAELPPVIQKKLAKYKRYIVLSTQHYEIPGQETAIIRPAGTKQQIAVPARACIVYEKGGGKMWI